MQEEDDEWPRESKYPLPPEAQCIVQSIVQEQPLSATATCSTAVTSDATDKPETPAAPAKLETNNANSVLPESYKASTDRAGTLAPRVCFYPGDFVETTEGYARVVRVNYRQKKLTVKLCSAPELCTLDLHQCRHSTHLVSHCPDDLDWDDD